MLSPDKVTQEIMLWDLRRRDVRVVSTTEADVPGLEDPPSDSTRLLLRDVLAKIGEYLEHIDGIGPTGTAMATVLRVDESSDVIVELIPPERTPESLPAPTEQIRPAR